MNHPFKTGELVNIIAQFMTGPIYDWWPRLQWAFLAVQCLDVPFSGLCRLYLGLVAHHELLFQMSSSVLQKAWLSSQT